MKKEVIWVIIGITLLFGVGFLIKNKEIGQKPIEKAEKTQKVLRMGKIRLNIEMADTDTKRRQGLSGREKLEENEGMLFVFEKEGNHGFWMKNMSFPIDIAWLDKDKKIIHIEKNIGPETYPKVFSSTAPGLYVLETNADFFESNKIKIGDIAEF